MTGRVRYRQMDWQGVSERVSERVSATEIVSTCMVEFEIELQRD